LLIVKTSGSLSAGIGLSAGRSSAALKSATVTPKWFAMFPIGTPKPRAFLASSIDRWSSAIIVTTRLAGLQPRPVDKAMPTEP
jgi:hypothetical protein